MSDKTHAVTTTTDDGEPVFARYVHTCCEHADELAKALEELRRWANTPQQYIDDAGRALAKYYGVAR